MFLDYLFFVAEKRELIQLIRKTQQVTSHFYVNEAQDVKYGIYITGVGKKAVALSLKNLGGLNVTASKYINLGNSGALKNYFPGTIVEVGTVYGNNGKSFITLNSESHFTLLSVNSTQNKKKLLEQFRNIDLVDMELFTLANKAPQLAITSYKIILDKPTTNLNSLGRTSSLAENKLRIPSILSKMLLTWQIKNNSLKLCNFVRKKFFE